MSSSRFLTVIVGIAATASVVAHDFVDEFNGNSVDTSLWTVDTGQGVVSVANGFLSLSAPSSASGFPALTCATNPFAAGSWTFEIRMRYTNLHGGHGDGVELFRSPDGDGSPYKTIIWQDLNNLAFFCSNTLMFVISGGDTEWHTYRLVYTVEQNVFAAYVDEVKRGEVPAEAQCDTIRIGNPRSGCCNGWNSFDVDYVRITPAEDTWHVNPANGHLYKRTDTMNWKDARRQAVLWGGQLVTINDQAEQDWLLQTFGDSEDLFIGLRDVKPPLQKWRWESGEAVSYTNWNTGEPTDTVAEPVVMLNNGLAGKWNNVPMSFLARGIVERTPPQVQRLAVGSDGATVTSDPLEPGKRYVIEASGSWQIALDGRLADANYWRDQDGVWREKSAPGLLVNNQNVAWMGSPEGVYYATHTYSPSHVYRYIVVGNGEPISFRVNDTQYDDNFGGLQVRIYSPVPTTGTQADALWPLHYVDRNNTGFFPWAIGPDVPQVRWSLPNVGLAVLVSSNGNVYCLSNAALQCFSPDGLLLSQATLPGSQISIGGVIGADGSVFLLAHQYIAAFDENLNLRWQYSDGGLCGPVVDDAGNLYYGGWFGGGQLYSRTPSGQLSWSLPLSEEMFPRMVLGPDNLIYLKALHSPRIYVFSIDGQSLGNFDGRGNGGMTPVFDSDGTFYTTTADGMLHCFNPDRTPRWEQNIGATVDTTLALAPDHRVVSQTFSSGLLLSFLFDGTQLWSTPQDASAYQHIRLDAQGTATNANFANRIWSVDFMGSPMWNQQFAGTDMIASHVIGPDGTIYATAGGLLGTLYAIGPGSPVLQETFLTIDNTTIKRGETADLAARLALGRNSGGARNRTVRFYIDHVVLGQAVTDWRGIATLPYAAPSNMAIGPHVLTANFDGDTNFWNCEGDGTLYVRRPVSQVEGQIFLENYEPDPTGQSITFELLDGGGQTLADTVAILDSTGHYSFEMTYEGPCSLRAKGSHWLSSVVSGLNLSESAPAIANMQLPNGDADGDNLVSLIDLNRILIEFTSTASTDTDLDGSGKVDLPDLNIVFLNFARAGQ